MWHQYLQSFLLDDNSSDQSPNDSHHEWPWQHRAQVSVNREPECFPECTVRFVRGILSILDRKLPYHDCEYRCELFNRDDQRQPPLHHEYLDPDQQGVPLPALGTLSRHPLQHALGSSNPIYCNAGGVAGDDQWKALGRKWTWWETLEYEH